MKLLERAVGCVEQRLVLVAPPERAIPDTFTSCDFDASSHSELIREVQRVRGAVYLEDGAIDASQLSDGLHKTPEDEYAWHVLLFDEADDLIACGWYREHHNRVEFSRLRLRHCPLATDPDWRDKLWSAVTGDIAQAHRDGLRFAEVGGWAVAEKSRCTVTPMLLALATYSLSRICGGAIGITTATTRHGSCDILSRLGGHPLNVRGEIVPRYYDSRYRCDMEILRFDSRMPHPRFEPFVAQLEERLAEVSVVARPYWPMMREPRRPTPLVAPPPVFVPDAIDRSQAASL